MHQLLTALLKFLTKPTGLRRLPVYALLAIAALFCFYQYWSLLADVRGGFVSFAGLHVVTKRVEVPVTKILTRVKTRVVSVPVEVYVPLPPELKKIEHSFDFKLLEGEHLLGIWDIGSAPRGGTAVAKLQPSGHVDFSFKALPPKTFEFGPWTAGLGVDPLDTSRWQIFGEKELRIGKVFIRADAGVEAHQGALDFKTWVSALYKF